MLLKPKSPDLILFRSYHNHILSLESLLISVVTRCPSSSPVVPRRPRPSTAVFRYFPPSPSRHQPSPTTPGRSTKAPAVPYTKLSHIVGLIVLHNDGRPASSRTRTDCIVTSLLVRGSWQFPRRALPGPWTVANTGKQFIKMLLESPSMSLLRTKTPEQKGSTASPESLTDLAARAQNK